MLKDEISRHFNELTDGRVTFADEGEEACLPGRDGAMEPPAQLSASTVTARPANFAGRPAQAAAGKIVLRDTFARDIAQYRYENQKTLFAHLSRKDWPRLVRVRLSSRRLLKNNPFRSPEPAKVRASKLRSEAPRLYSAMAFAMWQYGRVMNAHVTILWKLIGVTDHDKAVRILSKYNHEAAKWLSVGDGDNVVRSRFSRRSSGSSAPHAFVYVHEQALEKGFHTHELMYVPLGRAQEFAEWSRDCLARLSGCARADEAAVFFSPASQKRRKFRPYAGGRESFAVDRQWRWFRYLTKSLDPEHRERSPIDGAWHVARDIFQMTKPFMVTGPVSCRKLAGCSENIGPSAQQLAGFKSKFERGDWAGLYNGSELDDYRADMAALAEAERAQAAQAELRAMLENLII